MIVRDSGGPVQPSVFAKALVYPDGTETSAAYGINISAELRLLSRSGTLLVLSRRVIGKLKTIVGRKVTIGGCRFTRDWAEPVPELWVVGL